MSGSQELLTWLRATAEATRLRLLALCAQRELSVSDLADVLGQSEPRVSRHLRILTEAGLVERVRQGQWVHYRLARATPAARFVQGLLTQLDRTDPALTQDRQRACSSSTPSAAGLTASRLGRELRAVLEAEMAPRVGRVLVVGVEHPQLLSSAAKHGAQCIAIAHSRRAAQSARARSEREQLACRIVLASGGELLGERDVARLGEPFAAVVIDHLAVTGGVTPALLARVRAVLAPQGRLWLFERYEAAANERVVEHPIARLRRQLAEAGMECQRIRPIEADGQHVLAASAASARGGLFISRAG